MSANFKTILILGATSGQGEAFARRFHAQGKKVIAAGRRFERLQALRDELKGLEIAQIDVTDFSTIESKIKALPQAFPTLDTVMLFARIMNFASMTDPSTSTNESIISEVNVNLISPMILTRLIVPHLLSLKQPASLVYVSSGLAFVPFSCFSVYSSTKAGIHYLAVNMRAELAGTNVNVIELVPPYIDTPLDAHFRLAFVEYCGGPEKAQPPMSLESFMDESMAALEKIDENGKPLGEIGVGFGTSGISTWRMAFQPTLTAMHIKG